MASSAGGEIHRAVRIMALRAVHRFRARQGGGRSRGNRFEDLRMTSRAFLSLIFRREDRVL